MSESAADYTHGEMEVAEHEATYERFGAMAKWGSLTVAVLLLMLTLWFCTDAGFMAGLIAGIVVAAAGVWFLRSKIAEEL
jgi:thiamine transporter ThiT